MKYGVSSYSFRNYIKETKCDYLKICDLAKEMGYEGIEFIPLCDETVFGFTCDEMEEAKKIREHCEKIGLEIIAYTVGGNLLAEDIQAEEERLKARVDVAEALGVKLMRHDSVFSLPKKPFYSYREAIKDMAPVIRRITEYAKSKGIRTCTENHGMIMQAPERMEQLIREVNHENYGWLVDMGNFLVVDYNPVEAVKIAAPYAFHVHAKDFIVKKGDTVKPYGFATTSGGNYWRGTVLGHGSVPIINCLSILKRAGYDGWVSVEFEGMENNLEALRAGIQYLKDVEALI